MKNREKSLRVQGRHNVHFSQYFLPDIDGLTACETHIYGVPTVCFSPTYTDKNTKTLWPMHVVPTRK